MKQYGEWSVADDGKQFVLTKKGYDAVPSLQRERTIGKPIIGRDVRVYSSWVTNGWVEEKEIER